MPRFTVIFSNSGGELSREHTDTAQGVSRIVVDRARAETVFAGGDTIRIIDHEEEQPNACEIYVAMNEDGDWVVCSDESEALGKLAEDCGGYHARVVKITIRMSPPVMAEAAVDVPDDAGTKVEIAST